jgi:hypothetical protein
MQADRPPIVEWPFPRVIWPKMPEFPKPRLPQVFPSESQIDETKNAWTGQSADPQRPSPLQAVRDSAQRVGESTRAAWRKTVDTLTPGQRNAAPSRIASRELQPPFWKRMFAPQPEPPQGPRTMSEWVGQDRVP